MLRRPEGRDGMEADLVSASGCQALKPACPLSTAHRTFSYWDPCFRLEHLLRHGLVFKSDPRSWRTKTDLPRQELA
jgi:hypothetical protein